MRRAFLISGLILLVALPAIRSASAWYDHLAVMDRVQIRLEREFPIVGDGLTWGKILPAEAIAPQTRYSEIAGLLLLQSGAGSKLVSKDARTFHELLRTGAEDPDHGIDADLPDSADPSDDRKYMGGSKGQGSQGFRHMYWAGWKWNKPVTTLQFPARNVGQAVDRIELLANEARDRIRKGDLQWGVRILGWTAHYLQDLTQPFHAVEVPSLRMVPWSSFFSWPPTEAFDTFLGESTRTITNYHWAYEGYVRHALLQGEASPFKACFEKSGGSILVSSPRELALEISLRSVANAGETGRGLVDLVGLHLKEPGVSIPLNPAQIDVEDLLKNPKHSEPRERLNSATCASLRLSTDATIWITRWVFGR